MNLSPWGSSVAKLNRTVVKYLKSVERRLGSYGRGL